jgi:hypothetical protein
MLGTIKHTNIHVMGTPEEIRETKQCAKKQTKPSTVVHACDPSAEEARAGWPTYQDPDFRNNKKNVE